MRRRPRSRRGDHRRSPSSCSGLSPRRRLRSHGRRAPSRRASRRLLQVFISFIISNKGLCFLASSRSCPRTSMEKIQYSRVMRALDVYSKFKLYLNPKRNIAGGPQFAARTGSSTRAARICLERRGEFYQRRPENSPLTRRILEVALSSLHREPQYKLCVKRKRERLLR